MVYLVLTIYTYYYNRAPCEINEFIFNIVTKTRAPEMYILFGFGTANSAMAS